MDKDSVFNSLHKLWRLLSAKRRREMSYLLLLMMLVSIFEVISIGSIIPFIGVITNLEQFSKTQIAGILIKLFHVSDVSNLIIICSWLFGLAALFNGLLRITLLRINTKISFGIAADLSSEVLSKSLYQPYAVQINRNSSHLVDAIANKTNSVVYGVLMPILILISTAMMVIFILIGLVFIQPEATISCFFVFSILYCGIIKISKSRLSQDSISVSQESKRIIRLLHESFGGIRDILINRNQQIYCDEYKTSDRKLRDAQSRIYFIGNSPRFIMETLGLIFITVLAFFVTQHSGELVNGMAILAALAFSAQRLLPMLQQGYLAWSGIRSSEASLNEIIALLNQSEPIHEGSNSRLSFEKAITLRDAFFKYEGNPKYVLENINIEIVKGDRVGIIGETGSGKSTLVDLIMGLLVPTHGVLSVDGVHITKNNCNSWYGNIAHVPQDIFLADKTITENIALGIPSGEIEMDRVKKAASFAQISSAILEMPLGYNTMVGERGVKLSGGQRQRIAIARAFYRSANLIIFDEGTSALDIETENAVMESINQMGSDITVIMIAHRLSTLRNCNKLFKVADGFVTIHE